MAPAGTETVRVLDVAVTTVAFTAPKKTILSDIEVLNPVPVIVTDVPIGPDEGENEVIDNWATAC